MATGTKYRPNDPNNFYDPASSTDNAFADMLKAYERGRNDPHISSQVHAIANDPIARQRYEDYMAEEARDAEMRGENMHERMRREKREWAVRDALSMKLKDRGNDALREGDVKKAWFMYSLALEKSSHEPAYSLNRAAASLQLGLYLFAELDATQALQADMHHGPMRTSRFTPKAYFRRAQARRYMGTLNEAEQDILVALRMLPEDAAVIKEQKTICDLQHMDLDDLKTYRKKSYERTSPETFKEIIGYTVEDIDAMLEKMREQEEYEDALDLD
ncbi:TPR-like protein [Peniophora sp. CONT]|nr:TPR-like protein [Peniophora sp. CONT]